MPIEWLKIAQKWQKKWEAAKAFQADPDPKRKKFFVTFPYPYLNGAPHIGHAFSSIRTDVMARFKRMQGFNVLYPQGFHATGEPILGVVDRLKENDPVQIQTMKTFGATEGDVERFKKDAKFLVEFWKKHWVEDLNLAGFSIDWRRTFITTSLTPTYSRFIEWQYNTLKKAGYVAQGTHPVIWCPHCQSPTGDHDRLEGEGESPIEYVLLKFELEFEGKRFILPAATLRPETIYGVTNMWVNSDVDYVRAKVGNETWVISKDAAKKLADQLKDVKVQGEVRGSKLLGLRARDPLSGKMIPILPAHFVDAESATGVVMSVPAHAPYDYAGVLDLLASPEQLERYGVNKQELEPISLIKTPELDEWPAVAICKKMGITTAKQQKALDDATSIVYKREFHLGRLKNNCGEYSGKKVSEIKEHMVGDFKKAGIADTMWETTAPVVCRCTTKNHVKILENQWFLRFSDKKWKAAAKRALGRAKVWPDEARNNFESTIDWLKDKACARRTGLGTPLPWDKEWIVETLSDSTVYMAYYTIARIINEKKIPAGKLTDAVFDFVFLGKGDATKVAKAAKLDAKLLKLMRAEFEYWYPVDFRNSGKDLVANHLTFFIFHHAAIWPKERYWPAGISVNGFVNVEGEKMSKSKGNVIPLRDLLEKFGPDLVRINIAASAEGLDDADWRAENIKGYRSRLEYLAGLADVVTKARRLKPKRPRNIDKWLFSRHNDRVAAITAAYESVRFRTAANLALFDATNDLKWYLTRVGGAKNVAGDVLGLVYNETIKMLAPLVPHFSEEMWAKIGGKGLISLVDFPKPVRKVLRADKEEELVKNTYNDVREIMKIIKIEKPKSIAVFAIKEDELSILKEAADFLSRELGAKIEIIDAKKSTSPRAAKAKVGKPGIEIVS